MGNGWCCTPELGFLTCIMYLSITYIYFTLFAASDLIWLNSIIWTSTLIIGRCGWLSCLHLHPQLHSPRHTHSVTNAISHTLPLPDHLTNSYWTFDWMQVHPVNSHLWLARSSKLSVSLFLWEALIVCPAIAKPCIFADWQSGFWFYCVWFPDFCPTRYTLCLPVFDSAFCLLILYLCWICS